METVTDSGMMWKKRLEALALSIIIMVLAVVCYYWNHYCSALILLVGAVFLYFYIVKKVANRNWMDFTALFTAIWMATIGLAALRLLSYQKIWEVRTWINLILAVVVYQVGIPAGHILGGKIANWVAKHRDWHCGSLCLRFRKERLFWVCLAATVVATGLFIWNIQIKGYLPFFAGHVFNAYTKFYTKRMVFVTAAATVSPLAYWCIKRGNLPTWKKAVMWVCIVLNTFAFPMLAVNRGVFICASLMLTASVFFLNGKKFWVMVACLVVTFGFYEVGSLARNYTNEYLSNIFTPVQLEWEHSDGEEETEPMEDPEIGFGDVSEEAEQGTLEVGDQTIVFELPAQAAFLYGYFTVGHDNLNEAILYASTYTYGVRQLSPFNVILRLDWINQINENAEFYKVNYNLTTTNTIGNAYYDLREVGVIVMVLIWAVILGALEKYYLKMEGTFALAAVGNGFSPVILSFFSSWFTVFTFWMFWGTIFLFFLACSVTTCRAVKKRGEA